MVFTSVSLVSPRSCSSPTKVLSRLNQNKVNQNYEECPWLQFYLDEKAEATMWLSTRQHLCKGDPNWNEFIDSVGLSHLSEVRSIDSSWNPCVEGNFPIDSMSYLWDNLESLLPQRTANEYHLLYVDSEYHDTFSHPQLTFLGYDLSDETHVSSLLNCGPWEGKLAILAANSRSNGLLELPAAKTAQALLPDEWNNDPHSYVTIWALYEVSI